MPLLHRSWYPTSRMCNLSLHRSYQTGQDARYPGACDTSLAPSPEVCLVFTMHLIKE